MKIHGVSGLIVFIKKEAVLFIAAVFAFLSIVFVKPDARYFSYIDYSVLGILFCLMVVVAGLKELGVFEYLSQWLLRRTSSVKSLSILLVSSVFVCSMFITNDVALITFVPMTIGVFSRSARKKLIFIVVMETVAANLGSMMTPIGNPQNLYIYSFYRLHILSFLKCVLPAGIVSYFIIIGFILIFQNGSIEFVIRQRVKLGNKKKLLLYYMGLFLLCIAAVFHILDYRICVLIVLAATFMVDKKLLRKVDYSLLLTFVCFFVFAGNLERIGAVKDGLSLFLTDRVFVASVLCSQFISNVPAAMMISRFTEDTRNLLLGVNIGGLGTPVASLASLISFRLYSRSIDAAPGRFLGIFTICNISILVLLSCIVLL